MGFKNKRRGGITTDRDDPRLGHGSNDEPVEQNETYLVADDKLKAKGFVRPLRMAYVHSGTLGGCGARTYMTREIAETFAVDPTFYGSTFCVGCSKHRPVGPDGEFVWENSDDKVGT